MLWALINQRWQELVQQGIAVMPSAARLAPPRYDHIDHNMWSIDVPAVVVAKLPEAHTITQPRGGRSQWVVKPPEYFGKGSVCDNNRARNVECELPCDQNTSLSAYQRTSFMLSPAGALNWELQATKTYCLDEFVGEYVGEAINSKEKLRRLSNKSPTDPQYIHELYEGRAYLDAEKYGNAMRFLNHVCTNPNCRYKIAWVQGRKRIQVLANRCIIAGEALTASYGFENYQGATCLCGSQWCRGYMGATVVTIPGTNGTRVPPDVVQVSAEHLDAARVCRRQDTELQHAAVEMQHRSSTALVLEENDLATEDSVHSVDRTRSAEVLLGESQVISDDECSMSQRDTCPRSLGMDRTEVVAPDTHDCALSPEQIPTVTPAMMDLVGTQSRVCTDEHRLTQVLPSQHAATTASTQAPLDRWLLPQGMPLLPSRPPTQPSAVSEQALPQQSDTTMEQLPAGTFHDIERIVAFHPEGYEVQWVEPSDNLVLPVWQALTDCPEEVADFEESLNAPRAQLPRTCTQTTLHHSVPPIPPPPPPLQFSHEGAYKLA